LQAAIGGKILARENKLLDKQKKRMKLVGKVDIPAEAFMVLVSKDT
jgi:translation elongation factor EF-4